jgi:hypothetical protein
MGRPNNAVELTGKKLALFTSSSPLALGMRSTGVERRHTSNSSHWQHSVGISSTRFPERTFPASPSARAPPTPSAKAETG